MRNDNDQLSELLQHEYTKITGYYTYTDVPEKVRFEVDGYHLKVRYPKELIKKPENGVDSFEGWILVCRRWGVFDKISFDWESPTENETIAPEFLYRVKHFSEVFKDWFELSKDAEEMLQKIDDTVLVSDKCILESIIEVVWHFETGKTLFLKIPDLWSIHFEAGKIRMESENKGLDSQSLSENDKAVYTPLHLVINRWSYLPTVPETSEYDENVPTEMKDQLKELIKVGFTERNFPYPSEY